jgi:hypothetical protein
MVTNPSDTGGSGDGSLRGEIAAANSGDTIVFADNLAGQTITLNPGNGPLYLDKDLTIQGPGADKLTISGNTATEVFDIPGGSFSSSGATVTITGLTIADGKALLSGGGISNAGTLTLDCVTLSGNHAGSGFGSGGGGISNAGTLTITNSTLSGNHADDSDFGGGGIDNGGTLTVCNSTLFGNTADNSVGGGGIYNFAGAVLTITSSTIAGNTADGNTIGGGGIENLGGGTLVVRNTILAGNSAPSGPDLAGDLGSQGHNLVGNTAGGSGFAASDLLNVNPQLGPLQYNGGPTQTMALLPGSPAINAGDNTGAAAYDQRGFTRIVGTVDIGAFEVQPSATQPTRFIVSAPANPVAGNAFAVTVQAVNDSGNPVSGYNGTVHISSSDGQAVLPADMALSNGCGTFCVTLKTAGSKTLTVADTAAGSVTGSTSLCVTPAAASTFLVSGYPSPAAAGAAGKFTVTALDPFGNIATGYGGTVHFTSSDARAALPADSTLTHGTGTFCATFNTPGTQTLTATDRSNPGLTGTQGGSTIDPAVTTLVVAGFPTSTTAGAGQGFTVTALDAHGDVATWYTGTVCFTSSDRQAVLPGTYTFTAADRGVHTFGATLLTAGTQSITATDAANPGLSGTEGNILVNPAAADYFVISAPSTVRYGVAFSLTVTVKDYFGNVVPGYTGTVHFSSTGTRASLPRNYTFTAADRGVRTFTGLVLRTRGQQYITVTDTLYNSLTGSVILNVV